MATDWQARAASTASARTPTWNGSKPSPTCVQHAKLATLLLPGIGTVHDLHGAYAGRRARRAHRDPLHRGRHLGPAHRRRARAGHGHRRLPDDGAHGIARPSWPRQAKLMESYGATCVYVTDSGGALTMNDVAERFDAFKDVLEPDDRDRHARPSQPVARASPTRSSAVEHGCDRVDASLGRHGRRCRQRAARGVHRRRFAHGLAARLRPVHADGRCRRPGAAAAGSTRARRSRDAGLGYAGVYSSFLRHAERASDRYDIPAVEILVELGRRRMVGGQEDMIVDVALDLVAVRNGEA